MGVSNWRTIADGRRKWLSYQEDKTHLECCATGSRKEEPVKNVLLLDESSENFNVIQNNTF